VLFGALALSSGVMAGVAGAADTDVSSSDQQAPAGAAPAPAPGGAPDQVVSSGEINPRSAQDAAAYWTPERMRAAKPADLGVVAGVPSDGPVDAGQASATPSASGPPGEVHPARPALGAPGEPQATAAPQALAAAAQVPRPYTNLPDRTIGKVFFTRPGWGDYVCSGTAVNSPNKSVVWTAGHCVEAGASGGFHTNWVFVPAYSSGTNGGRPYGTWNARTLYSLNGWTQAGNFSYDLGAAVVSPRNGQRLVNRVGGHGLRWNQPAYRQRSAFGYPALAPFNGWLMWRCNSGLVARDNPPGAGPNTMRINCNMTGGSSGGPWLAGLHNGLGYVESVNSYGYVNQPNAMYGPYQEAGAKNLYDRVKSA